MALEKDQKVNTHPPGGDGKMTPDVEERQHPDIDGGWAWVVVGGVFVYNMLMGGTVKSLGLFYVEFVHLFPEGPAKVGLIGLTFGLTSMLMSPLGGIAGDMVPVRVMTVVGGIIMMTSISCTSLAPYLWVAILTFGCIPGCILGFIDGPVLASIGWYFRRSRAVASGIAWTGSSIGNLVFPPLLSWSIAEYGIRGALLLMGALWLHLCAIGLLLRPLAKVKVRCDENEEEHMAMDGSIEKVKVTELVQSSNGSVSEMYQPVVQRSWGVSEGCQSLTQTAEGVAETRQPLLNGSVTAADKCQSIVTEIAERDSTFQLPIHANSDLSQHSPRGNCKQIQNGNQHLPLINMKSEAQETMATQFKMPNSQPACQDGVEIERCYILNNDFRNCTTIEPRLGNLTYITFLQNARMWVVLLVIGCGFFGYYTPFIVIPLWGEEQNIPKSSVALMLALIGLVEIVSRLTFGILIDRCRLQASMVLTFSYAIMGIAGQIVTPLTGFWPLMVYACIHGMLGGVVHIVMATLIGHVVPLHRTGSAMGLLVMQLNLASWPITFVSGVMKELTGSYRHMLRLSSGTYVMGAVLYVLAPLVSGLLRRACAQRRN